MTYVTKVEYQMVSFSSCKNPTVTTRSRPNYCNIIPFRQSKELIAANNVLFKYNSGSNSVKKVKKKTELQAITRKNTVKKSEYYFRINGANRFRLALDVLNENVDASVLETLIDEDVVFGDKLERVIGSMSKILQELQSRGKPRSE